MSRLLSRAVIIGIVFALAIAGIAGTTAETTAGRLGGDFPSFYGAGQLVLEGKQSQLYSSEAQAEIQEDLFMDQGEFLYFAYPPYTAVPYAGLAALPYRLAFVLHGLLSLVALWAAVRLARPMLPRLIRGHDDELAALAVLLTTYPILRAVLGGQNTAFTMLLVMVVWRAARDERPAIAGLALAGLLYKPQYGLFLVLMIFAARRFRILAWWSGGAMVAYGVGALMLGVTWPLTWLDQVSSFNSENLRANGNLMVSSMGWFANLASDSAVGLGVGLVLALLVAAIAGISVWRLGIGAKSMAVVLPSMVIASPSALYYDAGLAIGTMGLDLDGGAPRRRVVALFVVATSWTQPTAELLGWSPLYPWLVGLFSWSLVMLFRSRHGERAQ